MNLMISWDENKVKILMLTSMAQTLKKKAESTGHVDLRALVDEYVRLSGFLISIYPDAHILLPKRASLSSINDVKYAIEQLFNYTNAKAMPLFFRFMTQVRNLGTFRTEDSLTPLIPILSEWKLSVNWAVGVSALALMEVTVNKKLEELGLKRDGSFETRFKRLSSKAKEKRTRLPDLLASPFYKARNKVIHEGKEPTPEELEIIFKYLTLCSRSLKKI